jgi:hypothetical protein
MIPECFAVRTRNRELPDVQEYWLSQRQTLVGTVINAWLHRLNTEYSKHSWTVQSTVFMNNNGIVTCSLLSQHHTKHTMLNPFTSYLNALLAAFMQPQLVIWCEWVKELKLSYIYIGCTPYNHRLIQQIYQILPQCWMRFTVTRS